MTTTADPRSHVTPDAFAISDEVMGLPLASPGRRAVALALDGILIGIVSQLSWKLLGVIAAIAFFRVATRRGAVAGRVGRGFSYSVGCLGALILFSTVVVWTGVVRDWLTPDRLPSAPPPVEGAALLGDLVSGSVAAVRLRQATAEDEAVDLGVEFVRSALRATDTSEDDALAGVRDLMPEEPSFDVDVVMQRIAAEIGRGPAAAEAAKETVDADTLSAEEAWSRFLALEASDSLSREERVLREQLRNRLAEQVAADTLATLNRRLSGARRDVDELERERDRARDALTEREENQGLFGWLLSTVDQLGLTFGWGALYLATFMTLMKGQTPGKRALGLRVIRLDGQPIGWFAAFERAGGYAAGVATGLLGFAQILWDPNRQGIHDKIVATVVVREGAPRAPGSGRTGGLPAR
ncbi:MAG: RDD family protein [Gemmatimonadota bacterium]